MLILSMPFAPFQPKNPAPGGLATVFPRGRQQELVASCDARKDVPVTVSAYRREKPCSRAWVSKRCERHRQDKHRRGPSTSRLKRCSRDKSARRFAQDDDFVGVLKKSIPNKLALGASPRRFRPTYTGVNVGHPSCSLWPCYEGRTQPARHLVAPVVRAQMQQRHT
jgi:hypothetical protein